MDYYISMEIKGMKIPLKRYRNTLFIICKYVICFLRENGRLAGKVLTSLTE